MNMNCEKWFSPVHKEAIEEKVTEIYLFRKCSCGYEFDFRYPADKKNLSTISTFNIPYAICPECSKAIIFPPEKGKWRSWIFLIYMKVKLVYLKVKEWMKSI